MTADAKIGLLLGLVFIVIIAFLINGLPNFFRPHDNNEQLSVDVPEVTFGPNVHIPVNLTKPAIHDRSVPLRVSSPPEQAENFTVPLVSANNAQADEADKAVKKAVEEAVEEAVEKVGGKKMSDTYTVKAGDSIGTIARRVYGDEIGKKASTLDAIARANKLESPHLIMAGSVLEMPRLSKEPPEIIREATTPVRSIAEKVKDNIREFFNGPETIEYVVKPGDCLSVISSRQLGTCKRIDEIIKLNKDKIDDADDIVNGMVLKLPKS
jgi:nucleoid-associated protein YgaU